MSLQYPASAGKTLKHARLLKICKVLILLSCLSQVVADEIITGGPYDRKEAYVGGLSKYLFKPGRADVIIATDMFFREVIKGIGKEAQFIVLDSKAEIIKAMLDDKMDAVYVNPIDFLEIDYLLNPYYYYTISYGAHVQQKIYLITRSSNHFTRLSQLKDKKLVIPTGYALGQLFLDVSLAKAGFPSSQQFFSTVLDSNDNNSAVLDIFFDKADIAVVSNLAYEIAIELNPQIATKLDILMASEPMVPFIIGINKRVPNSFLLPIDNILENLLENPRTRHILSLFKADDVVKIDSAQLESVKALKQEYDQLLAAGMIQTQ